MFRHRLTLLVTVAVLIGLMAAPAAADKPTVIGQGSNTFADVDPCTGELHVVTINFTAYGHIGHNNNFVVRVERTGTTDSGYVLIGGSDHSQANKNGESGSFKDVWRNPDNGNKLQASGRFRMVGNSPVIDGFELRCVGGPTILP